MEGEKYYCAKARCPDGKWGEGLDCFDMPNEAAFCADEKCRTYECRTGYFKTGYTCKDIVMVTMSFRFDTFLVIKISSFARVYG